MSTLEQLGFTFQPQRRIFTVRDLVGMVRTAVEREYTDIWIGGEISNYRPAESGHLYFTLKDDATQVRSVIFRSALRYLKFKPADGLRVVARGNLKKQLQDILARHKGQAGIIYCQSRREVDALAGWLSDTGLRAVVAMALAATEAKKKEKIRARTRPARATQKFAPGRVLKNTATAPVLTCCLAGCLSCSVASLTLLMRLPRAPSLAPAASC